MQEMKCDVCGKKFKFGMGPEGPENCESAMFGHIDIWCPHCGAEYLAGPDGRISFRPSKGWGQRMMGYPGD